MWICLTNSNRLHKVQTMKHNTGKEKSFRQSNSSRWHSLPSFSVCFFFPSFFLSFSRLFYELINSIRKQITNGMSSKSSVPNIYTYEEKIWNVVTAFCVFHFMCGLDQFTNYQKIIQIVFVVESFSFVGHSHSNILLYIVDNGDFCLAYNPNSYACDSVIHLQQFLHCVRQCDTNESFATASLLTDWMQWDYMCEN